MEVVDAIREALKDGPKESILDLVNGYIDRARDDLAWLIRENEVSYLDAPLSAIGFTNLETGRGSANGANACVPSSSAPTEAVAKTLREFIAVAGSESWRVEALKLVDQIESVRSATATKELASRCRPAVKHYAIMRAQSVIKCTRGELPAHYKNTLMEESQQTDKLLDDIDNIIGAMDRTGA